MNRKLAVPLAVRKISRGNQIIRTRILKNDDVLDDLDILTKLAETRVRVEKLCDELETGRTYIPETSSISSELDFIKASIQLDLLQITGELEGVPYSDEVMEEAVA